MEPEAVQARPALGRRDMHRAAQVPVEPADVLGMDARGVRAVDRDLLDSRDHHIVADPAFECKATAPDTLR